MLFLFQSNPFNLFLPPDSHGVGLPPTFLMLTERFDVHVCFYTVSQHAALCWTRHALRYRRDWAAATTNCWMLHWAMWHQGDMAQSVSNKGSFVAIILERQTHELARHSDLFYFWLRSTQGPKKSSPRLFSLHWRKSGIYWVHKIPYFFWEFGSGCQRVISHCKNLRSSFQRDRCFSLMIPCVNI